MIRKKFRLGEREIKRVFRMKKPFFSDCLVANIRPNRLAYNRFALLLGGKQVHNAVVRNWYRRRFYDIASEYIIPHTAGGIDCVVLLKKGTVLVEKGGTQYIMFRDSLQALLKRTFYSHM